LGVEESHGYLVGSYARDKDGAVASMLMAEVAAHVKKTGRSLHEKLDALFWQHGYHAERLLNLSMPGSQGMARMQALMQRFRSDPPQAIAGMAVQSVRDYKNLTRLSGGRSEKFQGPQADLVMIDLDQPGNYLAVRPSGTEPKVKFYMFTFVPPEQLADLDQTRRDMEARLDAFEASL